MKRLLIGLTIVALITAFNAYQHRDNNSGTTEYEGYGFSFKYRSDLTPWVFGHPDYGAEATDLAGIVSARAMSIDENYLQYFVEWSTVQSIPVLEDAGAEYLYKLETDSHIKWRGSIGPRYLDKDGYQVVYWILNGTQFDLEFMVVHSCWVEPWGSLHAYRMYNVDVITPDVGYTTEMIEELFKEFMESFSSG
jgi:hypothetical protein